MLVLSRKQAESIQVDGGITIKVLEVRGGRVRLGIDAPQSVRIRRSEVVETDAEPLTSEPAKTPHPLPTKAPYHGQPAVR